MHALSESRDQHQDFPDRAGHLAVRLPGVGLRPGLRRAGGARHRAPGSGARRHRVRHRRDLRVGAQRADPRRGARRRQGLGLPGHEDLPAAAGRPGRRAARGGQREPARHPSARPVPGAPAQPGGQGRHDHARHARAAAGRAGGRGRRQQLLAGPLARRRAGPGRPGAEQPGPVQPRRPLARAGPAPVRRIDRPPRDRLQPAGPGAALRPVRPGPPPGEPAPGR